MPKIRPRLPKARNSSRYDGRYAQNASKGHGRSRQIFQVGVAASRLWRRSKAGESERLKQTSSLLNFYPLPLGYGEKNGKEGREGERGAAAPRAPHLNIKHTGGDKILAGARRRQRRRLVFHGKNGQSCLNHDAAAVRIASASSFVASPPPSQFGQLPVSRVVTRRRRRKRRLRRRKRRSF